MWRKEGKNEAFSMRASLSFCARDPKKNANAHFVSFFDERKKLINRKNQKTRSIKKREKRKRDCKKKRIAFFLSNAQLSSFLRPFFSSYLLTRPVKSLSSVELYHPRKYYAHHERQRFDVYEDDTNDDVLLLHILFFVVFFFFFFETVEANWTGRREKKERFEIFNITIVGGKSG